MIHKSKPQPKDNFESFFNAIKDFLFVLDTNGNIIHVNSTVTDRLGYSFDELCGQSVLIVHPRDQREEATQIVQKMIIGQEEACFIPLITKKGELIPVETSISDGIWDGNSALFGVSKDITKVKISEEKFASAFDASATLMAISTIEEGRFIDVNRAFIETIGYSREEIIGYTSGDLNLFVFSEQRENVKKLFEKKKSMRDISIQIRTKKGKILDGLFSVNQINMGNQNCWLTVMTDVTELVKLNNEQKKLLIKAERSSKAKSMFVANMSHEIRTPLNAILGYAQIMERKCETCPHIDQGLTSIIKSGEHLLELINNILETIKSDVSEIKINYTAFDIIKMIQELCSMFAHRPDARGIEISTQFGPYFPRFIHSDKGKIRQVLFNLLGNAIKYTEKGTIIILAEASLYETTDIENEIDAENQLNICISIKDTGFGIAPDQQELIFDAFEQSDSGYKAAKGTGLGLPISRRYARALGGDVNVKSELSIGSTFVFTFKTKRVSKLEHIQKSCYIKKVIGKSPKLLVVDDDQFNLEMLYTMLKNTGFDIFQSSSGIDALAQIKEKSFDAVLLDQCMPEMDGIETLHRIRALKACKDLPVIIITASGDVDAERMRQEGANAFVPKPFSRSDLLEKIQVLIGVKYEYVNEPSKVLKPNNSKLSDKMNQLLISQRETILSAIENGDILKLRQTISVIENQNSELAKKLTEFTTTYDYDGLRRFIGDL